MNKTIAVAIFSAVWNLAFSVSYLAFGSIFSSWWLLTLGAYYLVLSIVRIVVLVMGKRKDIMRFGGWMLISLCAPLVGTVVLSVVRDRGHEFHEIVMIAIALYAFTKITLATINWIKTRHDESDALLTLRHVSFADGFVSIFALQRSMLVSFEGMTETEIWIMNAVTGVAVCAVVFLLGLSLIKRSS